MGGMARCVLDPRTNQWVAWWDLVTTLALLFTALVTPWEVAFAPPPTSAPSAPTSTVADAARARLDDARGVHVGRVHVHGVALFEARVA